MYRCVYVVKRRRKARFAARKNPANGVNAAFNGENGSAAQDLQRPLPQLPRPELPRPELPRPGVSPQSSNMNALENTSVNRQLLSQSGTGPIQSGTGSMQSGTGSTGNRSGTRTFMRANPAYSSASSSGVDADSPISNNRPSSPSYDYPRMPQGAVVRPTPSVTSDEEGSGLYEN